jgi:hypothetical protein
MGILSDVYGANTSKNLNKLKRNSSEGFACFTESIYLIKAKMWLRKN